MEDFNCVICDFGFAHVIEQGQMGSIVKGLRLPRSGGFTFKYAAPEVSRILISPVI